MLLIGQRFFIWTYIVYILLYQNIILFPLYLFSNTFGSKVCVTVVVVVLGIFANDGTFPFNLLPEKFSRLVSGRINCKFTKRDNEVWLLSTRDILPKEELLLCYSQDGSYWRSVFDANQIQKIKEALQLCEPTLEDAENAISSLDI